MRRLDLALALVALAALGALVGCWEPDTRAGVYDPCHGLGLGDLFEPVGC